MDKPERIAKTLTRVFEYLTPGNLRHHRNEGAMPHQEVMHLKTSLYLPVHGGARPRVCHHEFS
jgi:hypothetical protein